VKPLAFPAPLRKKALFLLTKEKGLTQASLI
jgi:hypothetical protein